MKLFYGLDHFKAKTNITEKVESESAQLINSHMLMLGSSGVGKSHTIRRLVKDAVKSNPKVRIHLFDVHGDLEIQDVPCSTVQYGEQAPFGLNCFVVDPDPQFGGVRKCIQNFIRTVDTASKTALGVKQESVVRNLLNDVFIDFGFNADDPATWALDGGRMSIGGASSNRLFINVPFSEKEEAKSFGARWDGERKLWYVLTEQYRGAITKWKPMMHVRRYPTLADVVSYARQIHLERFLGSEQRSIRSLTEVNRVAKKLQVELLANEKYNYQNGHHTATSTDEIEKVKQQAVESYTQYIESIVTGFELDRLIKYQSADTLKSVIDRLSNLEGSGIFKGEAPPFDPTANVHRYKLNALGLEEKKMLVLFILKDIFYGACKRGETSDVVEIVVLDELGTYISSADDGGDGILGTICREARKFGLALWGAHQSPGNIPESMIASAGTKVILGLDEMFWDAAVKKFRVEARQLEWIKAQKTLAVQFKEKGSLKNRWRWVDIVSD